MGTQGKGNSTSIALQTSSITLLLAAQVSELIWFVAGLRGRFQGHGYGPSVSTGWVVIERPPFDSCAR